MCRPTIALNKIWLSSKFHPALCVDHDILKINDGGRSSNGIPQWISHNRFIRVFSRLQSLQALSTDLYGVLSGKAHFKFR